MELPDEPSDLKYTFSKEERLKSRKEIKELFDKGSSFFIYPFKTFYLPITSPDSSCKNKLLISISKKNHKKAVDRNLLKRRIREAYRLNKRLLTDNGPSFAIGLVFVSRQILSFSEIDSKLKLVMKRLNDIRSGKNE